MNYQARKTGPQSARMIQDCRYTACTLPDRRSRTGSASAFTGEGGHWDRACKVPETFESWHCGLDMEDERASGIERAVFGTLDRDNIDGWLNKHLRVRLGSDLSQIVFRSGRISAVYGVILSDGRQVAIKVHRRPADLAYLTAATTCQRRLADAGYPCPAPLDGPATTDGVTGVIETLLTNGEPGNGHESGTRRVMASALFEQLELLRGAEVDGLVAGAPAWSHYEHGPWPKPHDPIFDFAVT
ncbi:MAG: hypothetical protein J2P17_29705, partial [Mycobacterium sp.]|nr:hypothetical protein [Mycobacterium sp.]